MATRRINLQDFLDQLEAVRKLGPLKDLIAKIPEIGRKLADDYDERDWKHMEAIILSMTPAERRRPEFIGPHRRARISCGCGRSILEVESMLRVFAQVRDTLDWPTG